MAAETSSPPAALSHLVQPVHQVERYLSSFLDNRSMPDNLREAIAYALLGGGKRMRPLLTIQCCQAVGGDPDHALPPAGAIEMIHCFSLVHDDLPAMDDDDLRRGRPTLHKHTSDAMAILAGDMMMGLAFELITSKIPDPTLASQLTAELSQATNDMICGQVYDTLPDFDPQLSDLEKLKTIHRHKTGALLRCACRMGARVGGATEPQLQAITQYAEAVGLMFQVVDDLLDVTQTTEHLGKTAGKDVQQGKLTYPALLGLDASRQHVAQLQTQANSALSIFDQQADPLRQLCDYMAVRSN